MRILNIFILLSLLFSLFAQGTFSSVHTLTHITSDLNITHKKSEIRESHNSLDCIFCFHIKSFKTHSTSILSLYFETIESDNIQILNKIVYSINNLLPLSRAPPLSI